MVKRNPIQTYALAVCFASLFAGSFALAFAIYDLVQISFPESTNASYQAQMEVLKQQQLLLNQQKGLEAISDIQASTTPAGSAVTVISSNGVRTAKFYVAKAVQSLIISSIIILLCVGIFYFHWRMANRDVSSDA